MKKISNIVFKKADHLPSHNWLFSIVNPLIIFHQLLLHSKKCVIVLMEGSKFFGPQKCRPYFLSQLANLSHFKVLFLRIRIIHSLNMKKLH